MDYDTLEAVNPQEFALTTKNGDVYYLDKSFNIDHMPDEGGKIEQIIFTSENESKVVADNILDFMEKIMIPKIEEIIQKHKKI